MGHPDAQAAFQAAVEQAEHLEWRRGLTAVKRAEGGGQIRAASADRLLGGADIDGDCGKAYPNANRWDYAIGYDSAEAPGMKVFFVEVHTAASKQVSVMERKLTWLEDFLRRPRNAALGRLRREYHWVASGRIDIPQHLPQYRHLLMLRGKRQLRGPVKDLTLR